DVAVNTANDANCDNGAFCDGSETCDAVNDCQAGTAPNLSDGVDCTDDACDEANDAIVHAPDDVNCDDGNICTADACDEVSGCTHTPIAQCVAPLPAASRLGDTLLVALLLATTIITFRRRRPRPSE
ncbi:MAG: hypothetical protein AAEJ52_06565, partial [Myxococcota bacterium]